VGGKFEDKESPEDCILRETFEETGLRLTEYRYRGLVTFVSDLYPTEYMHLFTATDWEGEAHSCDEGELAWIKKTELLSLPLWEGDKIFLRLLDTDEPFFSLKLKYEGETLVLAVLNGTKIV
jgi:8-oxo-dGTP diphosphatase